MTKPPTWISIAVVRLQQTKTESSGARATGARPAKVFVTDTILLACIFFWQQVRKERVFIPGHLCAGLPQLHRCHEQCKQPFKVFEISQLCLFVCLSHLGSLVNCHAPDLCVVFHLVLQLEVRRPPERAMYHLSQSRICLKVYEIKPAEGSCLISSKETAVSEEKFPHSDRPCGSTFLSPTHTSTNPVSHWTLEIIVNIIVIVIVISIVIIMITVWIAWLTQEGGPLRNPPSHQLLISPGIKSVWPALKNHWLYILHKIFHFATLPLGCKLIAEEVQISAIIP